MSTVKTRLRVRPGAAPAPLLASVRPNSPLFSENGSERGASPAPDATRRTYSDVVASRPPSPVVNSEEEVTPPPNQNAGQGSRPGDSIRIPVVTSNKNKDVDTTSSESSDSDQHKDPHEWTTVQRKRCGMKRGTSKERSSRKDVPAAVDSALVEAEKSLTQAQKQKIALRQKKLNLNPPGELAPCEGPSGSKGKGIDPQNWGNVHLNEEEADVEAQRAALDSLRARKKRAKHDLLPQRSVAPTDR